MAEATEIQRLARILASARLLEAEALMRFSRNPVEDEMANMIDRAFAAASQYMWEHRDVVPKPCPGFDLHIGCMCTPPFAQEWLRRFADVMPERSA